MTLSTIAFLVILYQIVYVITQEQLKGGLVQDRSFVEATLKGFKATTEVLKGSLFSWSDHKTNRHSFIKYGNYSRTVNDFNSVGPSDVQEYQLPYGNKMTYGRVGNVEIMIYKSSLGNGGKMKIFQERKGTPEYIIDYTSNMDLFID